MMKFFVSIHVHAKTLLFKTGRARRIRGRKKWKENEGKPVLTFLREIYQKHSNRGSQCR